MKQLKDLMILLLILAAVFVSGMVCGRRSENKATAGQCDTVFVEKTRYYSRMDLKPFKEYRLENHFRNLTGKVLLPISTLDTVEIHDTTFLMLQRQFREYRGDDYFALVSGVDPTLDSLVFWSKDMIIDTRPSRRKNFLSIYAKPFWLGHFHAPIGLSYEYRPQEWMGIGASVGYDINTKQPYASAEMRILFGW